MLKHHHGYSLVEILLGLFLIAILLSLAVPSYQHYVQKTQRLEAKQALWQAALQLEHVYQLQGSYLPAGIQTPTIAHYGIPPTSAQGHYDLNLQVSTHQYQLTATALNSDQDCSQFFLNNQGEVTATYTYCWN